MRYMRSLRLMTPLLTLPSRIKESSICSPFLFCPAYYTFCNRTTATTNHTLLRTFHYFPWLTCYFFFVTVAHFRSFLLYYERWSNVARNLHLAIEPQKSSIRLTMLESFWFLLKSVLRAFAISMTS